MYTEDDDSEHKIALTLVLGIAIFTITGLLGFLGLGGYLGDKSNNGATAEAVATAQSTTNAATTNNAAATTAVTTTATMATAEMIANLKDDQSAFTVENGVVKFYFASGKSDLAQGGKEALTDVVKGIAAGQKATISGYHDLTGDPAKNAELAKQRATSVRDALVALGVSADSLELKKPEQSQGTGSNAEARRVEVALVK